MDDHIYWLLTFFGDVHYPGPCEGGHVFTFTSGNSGDPVPAGITCDCGETVACHEPCPTCGEVRLVAERRA